MPLFYFDIREGDRLIPDGTGLWFPTLEAAERDAVDAAVAIIRDVGPRSGGYDVSIEIRDEQDIPRVTTRAALRIERILLKA